MNGLRAALILLLALQGGLFAQAPAVGKKSEIFYAMDTTSIGVGREISDRVVRRMVDALVCRIARKSTPAEAWRTFVSPNERVGIKVATSGGPVSGTHPEVVNAIVEGLKEAGVPAKNIIVWDRNREDLVLAGYKPETKEYKLRWSDPATGYDPKAQLSAPVLGRLIWGDRKFGDRVGMRFEDVLSSGDQLSSQSFYSKVLSMEVDKVINVPSLTDSFLTGINGALANMTLANLDNWRRFTKAPAHGDPFLAEIYADPMIHEKVVLTILDALFMQFAGGPYPNPNFSVENYTLFAGRDPVAIDSTALSLIDEARTANQLPSIKDSTRYIESATQLGLGEFSESKIERLRVGIEGLN